MCYEHGGMIDDGTLLRLGKDNFRWIGGDDYGGEWLRETAEKLGLKVLVRSSTDQMHNIAVQGPKSRDILKEIIWTSPLQPSIAELEWFRFAVGAHRRLRKACRSSCRAPAIPASSATRSGAIRATREKVFDAVWEAGQPHGLKPMGLQALDMVRIEAGLIFAGYEFSDQTDPFEAGIGFTVPLKTKTDDFIGREALIRRKENPRASWSASTSTPMSRSVMATASMSAAPRSAWSPAACARRCSTRTSRWRGSTSRMRRSAPRSRSASSTATRSGCRRASCAFPHYDPQKIKPRS